LLIGCSGADERECLAKDLAALRRTLDEESYEKDVLQKTTNELRNSVLKLEVEKLENGRTINDLKQRISGRLRFAPIRTIFIIQVYINRNIVSFFTNTSENDTT